MIASLKVSGRVACLHDAGLLDVRHHVILASCVWLVMQLWRCAVGWHSARGGCEDTSDEVTAGRDNSRGCLCAAQPRPATAVDVELRSQTADWQSLAGCVTAGEPSKQ